MIGEGVQVISSTSCPEARAQRLSDVQGHPVLEALHSRLRCTLPSACEAHICALASVLSRVSVRICPVDLAALLVSSVQSVAQSSGQARSLVLHACAKTRCQGVRRRHVSRLVNSVLVSEFAGWDLRSVALFTHALATLGYSSKATYRAAAEAALAAYRGGACGGASLMHSLALLLWALARAGRTLSAPVSALFAVAAEALITQPRQRAGFPAQWPGGASEGPRAYPPTTADCTQLLWAFASAVQARHAAQQQGSKEWRGPPVSDARMQACARDALRRLWPDVPVADAATAILDRVASGHLPAQVRTNSLHLPRRRPRGCERRCGYRGSAR
jgi:hypothetical protein